MAEELNTIAELRMAILNIAIGLTDLTEEIRRFSINYPDSKRLCKACLGLQSRLEKVSVILVKDYPGRKDERGTP
jgi:hypothetical protein